VHYTTSCNTQSSAPEDGRDQRPKHVELIEIINKPLFLHLVGVYITYINDSCSNKHQIYVHKQTSDLCSGFITTAQEGGKVVNLAHRPHLRPGNPPGTRFC
jgi:hypothetical protein